jgi:(p)ppGpp synthase/HD superfamily hydrolase
MDGYQRAIDFAARAHRGQKVPGKPYTYIVHLSNVTMEIMAAICAQGVNDPDLAVTCGLLHDVIEDTRVRHEQIEEIFGKKVADGVLALSEDRRILKGRRLEDSIGRIREQAREIWMVKLADRITNLQKPPGHWPTEKRKEYLQDAEYILESLSGCNVHLERRLETKLGEYAAYITA